MTPIGFDIRTGTLLIVGNNVYQAKTLTASLDGQGMVSIISIAGRTEQYIHWDQITDLLGDVFASSDALMAYLVGEFGKQPALGLAYPFTSSMQVQITHSLGFYPNVIIVDSAGDPGLADPHYPDINTVIITFSAPTTGTAYLS